MGNHIKTYGINGAMVGKNQARMHVKNGHVPYTSTVDGISNFPEVATAVGVYLGPNDEVKLVAPYGIDDLVNLIVRPTPFFWRSDERAIYHQRLVSKQWELTWNRLQIVR